MAVKITKASVHLMNEIAAGRNRIFYMVDRPNGWVHLERGGLAVRVDDNSAALTEKGEQFLRDEAEIAARINAR